MSDELNESEVRHLLAKEREIALRKDELKKGLPHLYGWDWYAWAWDFFQSRNKMTLLCAANQISKSSTQIRKAIEWCGNTRLWPELWKSPPRQYWYLYPDKKTATSEFHTKWVDFLPAAGYRQHPTYGWEPIWGEKRIIDGIKWNSGVTLWFKTYAQDVFNLQGGTCHAIFADEELPEELFSELTARLFATDGYFSMVFTATLNQNFWKMAMEGRGEMEKFPDAMKQTVSMFDCQTYRSGKPGAFSEEKIKRIIALCKSETEIQRRVYGKFVSEVGRKYPQFDAARHFVKPHPIEGSWRKYAAVDLGGGGDGHPPAMAFVAVRPDQRYGVVYKGWRGLGQGEAGAIDYSYSDVLNKFLELRGDDLLVSQKFDQNAKDFGLIATRCGESFLPSDKSHERGESVVNTLFKNDMLAIFQTEELVKLGDELSSLMLSTAKRKAKDDLCDAMRYAVVEIPWDWSAIKGDPSEADQAKRKLAPYTPEDRLAMEISERRGEFFDEGAAPEDGWGELEQEFADWQAIAGG